MVEDALLPDLPEMVLSAAAQLGSHEKDVKIRKLLHSDAITDFFFRPMTSGTLN